MTFNTWFSSLPEEQQEIYKQDKWMLANAAFEAGKQYSVKAETSCEHDVGVDLHYDYVVCRKCGNICTDADESWGIAKNKWFKNKDAANFYRLNGRLPE